MLVTTISILFLMDQMKGVWDLSTRHPPLSSTRIKDGINQAEELTSIQVDQVEK